MSAYHKPVLLAETIGYLQIHRGEKFIDATAGGGGHTDEIYKLGGTVLAIDRDQDAIDELTRKYNGISQIYIRHGNFLHLRELARDTDFTHVHGILFDLGVSSHQMDSPDRGFSMRWENAKIDMRMDRQDDQDAEYLLNNSTESELEDIFGKFGEEDHARALSHAVVIYRKTKKIQTMGDFMHIISSLTKNRKLSSSMPRILQAIRISVNDELNALRLGLSAAKDLLIPGGRLVVISFHSLEDRIVKLFMLENGFTILTKKPVVPSYAEVSENNRSRSAKLRAALKI